MNYQYFALYTAKELGYLIDLFFRHLSELLLLLMNGWQMVKLNSMDYKRTKARGELTYLIQENKKAIERTGNSSSRVGSDPDDLPPSMRIDP